MLKTEGLVKYPVVFFKPIQLQYDLMFVIFTIPLHKWPWHKFVPINIKIAGYQTVNVCYVVVIG